MFFLHRRAKNQERRNLEIFGQAARVLFTTARIQAMDAKSFEELKEVSSSHQHSIFIDLGKILSDSARPVYFIPLVSLVPKLQTAGLLWSSVIRGKKMKMVGNFATWWHAGIGRHLVDVLRDDGKFELAVRRMESKHGGGWLDDIFDGFEAQELAQFNKEETHFQNDNVW